MTELEKVLGEVKQSAKQIAINKTDEVKVMVAMLNDKEFKYQKYEKNVGRVGEINPRSQMVNLATDIIFNATGLEKKNCAYLADNLTFTKKDAQTIIELNKEFLDVYTSTGRKINLIQNERTEANVYTKKMGSTTKAIPNKEDGTIKNIKTSPYTKLASQSSCPKYNK
jgi:hypothetical protein